MTIPMYECFLRWRCSATIILRVDKIDGHMVTLSGDDDEPLALQEMAKHVGLVDGEPMWAMRGRSCGRITVEMASPPHDLLWSLAQVKGDFEYISVRDRVCLLSVTDPTIKACG